MLHTYILGKLYLKVFVDDEMKKFELNKYNDKYTKALQMQIANKVITIGMNK